MAKMGSVDRPPPHYAEIDGLFDMPAGTTSARPDHDPVAAHLDVQDQSCMTGARKHVASLGGIACN
eukprot:492519-Pleurochrysis_carterae.AAC.1